MSDNKEKRINRIIKKIRKYGGKVKSIKTMKVSVELTDDLRKKLDILLEDADNKQPRRRASGYYKLDYINSLPKSISN